MVYFILVYTKEEVLSRIAGQDIGFESLGFANGLDYPVKESHNPGRKDTV
jgi:hypothetical protein